MSIPTYVMQTLLLTRNMCDKLDGMVRQFWWGQTEQKHHVYLKAWDNICAPKLVGGLGIRKFKEIKTAFITKLGWTMCA